MVSVGDYVLVFAVCVCNVCVCVFDTNVSCSCPLYLLLTESDDEYSDDDDMSWKVRRSSVKCLEVLISTRRDLLLDLYTTVCPALLARFREREENVRVDIFTAFVALLRQTRHPPGLVTSDPREDPTLAMLRKQVATSPHHNTHTPRNIRDGHTRA